MTYISDVDRPEYPGEDTDEEEPSFTSNSTVIIMRALFRVIEFDLLSRC